MSSNKHPNESGPFSDNEYWEFLDDAIDRFEKDAVKADGELDLNPYLPVQSSPFWLRVLVAVVKMDIERNWKNGCPALAEKYFDIWPEILTRPDLAYEVVESECRSRAVFDQSPDVEEIKRRFPQFAKRLDVESRMVIANDDVLQHSFLGSFLGCRTQERNKPSYTTGQKLGRYEVLDVIDQGGMGTVYRAFDAELGRDIAIKVLHSSLEMSQNVRELILGEARLTAKLNHPSIVPVYDVGQADDGQVFFVMEFVQGNTLAEIISKEPLTVLAATDVGIQIAEALEYAHQNRIVHRDIKPANVIIDPKGRVRVTDFGLAMPTDSTAKEVGLSGTLPYIPPEQLAGKQIEPDFRGDIWALGVLLYESVTQQRPFTGNSKIALSQSIEKNRFKSFRDIGVRRSKRLDAICRKCLNPNPSNRYESAKQLVGVLKDSKRIRLAKPFIAAVLLLGVISLLSFYWMNRPFQPPPESSIARIETCDELDDCGIVVVVNTGGTVDLDKAREYVLSNHAGILMHHWLRNDSASHRNMLKGSLQQSEKWLSWEFPMIMSNPNVSKTHDWMKPETTSLKLKVALSVDGTMQIGTKSNLPQEQFLTLALHSGLDNYTDFAGNTLTAAWTESIIPENSMGPLCPQNTQLAVWLNQIYKKLQTKEVFRNGPRNNYDFFRCPFELRNYFEYPISVVDGRLWHLQFDHKQLQFDLAEYVRETPTVLKRSDRSNYDRWSPIPIEKSDEDYKITQTFEFEFENKVASAAQLTASVDDDLESGIRNSSCFVARGLDQTIAPWPEGKNSWNHRQDTVPPQNKRQFLSATKDDQNDETAAYIVDEIQRNGTLYGMERKYAGGANALVYNMFPEEIELIAYSRYSVVRPVFRLVTFGKVTVRTNTAVEKIGDSKITELSTPIIEPSIKTYPRYAK